MDFDGSFSVADARRAGMTQGLLRSGRWSAPYYGIRSSVEPADVLARCRSYATKMRADAAFTSVTAARLWGFPLPSWVRDDVVHVSTPHESTRPGGRGVRGSQHDRTWEVVTGSSGLRLFSPASTWVSLARVLEVPDLVAAGDYAVTAAFGSDRPALTRIDSLKDAVGAGRRIGATRLRSALELVRPGSFSRPESLARVLLMGAGVPEPVPNFRVSPLLTCDLAWPEWKVAVDYQGAGHRTASQYARDLPRRDLARREGWELIFIAKDDVFVNPFDFLGRVRSRLSERGATVLRFDPRKLPRMVP